MTKVKEKFIYYLPLVILSLSGFFSVFWLYYYHIGYSSHYIGNIDAIGWLLHNFSFYSPINLGQVNINTLWTIVNSSFFLIIRTLWLNPFIAHSILGLLAFHWWIFGIFSLWKHFDKHINHRELFFISVGFLFSTYIITFFEDYIAFVYIYWLLPLKLYATINYFVSSKYRLFGFIFTTLIASINLPFAIFSEILCIGLLYFCVSLWPKKVFQYSAIGAISILIGIFPAILYTFLDFSFAKYVLSSEYYYRDYTTVFNVIRWVVTWDFSLATVGINAFKPYAFWYTSPLWLLTMLWGLVPIIVLYKNKKHIFINGTFIFLIFLSVSIILWYLTPISSFIYTIFTALPFDNIFRNTAKFFFLIYGAILLLLIFNRHRKMAAITFALASLPVLIYSILWKNISTSKINHHIPTDYDYIYQTESITKSDRILLFPQQYFPAYKDQDATKIYMWPSLPWLFWTSEIVLSRCAWCANPRFLTGLNHLYDITSPERKNYLKTYGITKVVYDGNTDTTYYPNTLTMSWFLHTMKKQWFQDSQKHIIWNILFYDTSFPRIDNLTICDAWRYRPTWNLLPTKICPSSRASFIRQPNDFHILYYAWILQILLFICFGVYLYHKEYNSTDSNSKGI